MTSRNPKVGDSIVVDGETWTVTFISEQYGLDYEDEDGNYAGSISPDEYDSIGYATPALDSVSHPAHYAHPSGVEVIEITKHESFLRGNIIKYVLRAPYKGSELEDLQKAAQYLQWEIVRVQGTAS